MVETRLGDQGVRAFQYIEYPLSTLSTQEYDVRTDDRGVRASVAAHFDVEAKGSRCRAPATLGTLDRGRAVPNATRCTALLSLPASVALEGWVPVEHRRGILCAGVAAERLAFERLSHLAHRPRRRSSHRKRRISSKT